MNKTLYQLIDWPQVETIIYSEHDHPEKILGPHLTKDGLLIHAYLPNAVRVFVNLWEKSADDIFEMEQMDEGFFSVLLPCKKVVEYNFIVDYENRLEIPLFDPYSFELDFTEQDSKRFNSGIHYDIYHKLGAHPEKIGDIRGCRFAVWAPNAKRVSVVGDFNQWDGRCHPMIKHDASGVFELFIPNVEIGELYKFELKLQDESIMLKSDPYGNYHELRPKTASRVWSIQGFSWQDKEYLKNRKRHNKKQLPMNIYEVHLGTFRRPNTKNTQMSEGAEQEFYGYRTLAKLIVEYVKEMGYTHIELMPIMEHPYDGSWGYQLTGYYAPTSRYGTPEDFMYFVDYMHQNEIGVILDWVPAHFPKDAHGLASFDGTCLYEHLDPRKGEHPHWGTLIYNYGRPQVSNFLIANALFWLNEYHIDGIRVDAVASMLYLDYGREFGEWLPNIYGGNENLEAMEFLKHLNSIVEKRNDGTFMIAEESTAWPKVSYPAKDGGLGFHYKWNMGWMNDILDYMRCDPLFRSGRQDQLIFSMIYNYSEHFILVLSHDEVVHGKYSLLNKMPGNKELKFSNLRVLYGFMYTHPGKKLLFMGQEFGMQLEWNEEHEIQWELLEEQSHAMLHQYVKDLNLLYLKYKALYELDYDVDGFEWNDFMDNERSIISFLRKGSKKEDILLVVCNFTPVVYEKYKLGVPFAGRYKEIFNSDKAIYGGENNINHRVKQSKVLKVHERENSIMIKVPPLGIAIFTCTPMTTHIHISRE